MAKAEKRKEFFNIGEDWEVTNVRVLDFGTFFTLKLPGLQLFNLRVVPAGRDYDAFIAPPEDKGRDDNYYKRFLVYFTEEDTEKILAEVERKAKKSRK